MAKSVAIGIGFVVAATAAGALLVAKATPEKAPVAAPASQVGAFTPVAGNKAFVPTCKAGQVADLRPDPAWVNASFAHDNCQAPVIPAAVDGESASQKAITGAVAAAKSYAGMADIYQRCIENYVSARRAAADKSGQTVDGTLAMIENHRIAASQTDKKFVSARAEAEVIAFNAFGSDCPD